VKNERIRNIFGVKSEMRQGEKSDSSLGYKNIWIVLNKESVFDLKLKVHLSN